MENFWVTIIFSAISLVVGYVAGIYFPLKFRKEDQTPNISISPLQTPLNCFDITNHGGDILDMIITISWLQDNKKESRTMQNFFNYDENGLNSHPHKCNSLKRGDTKRVADCPFYSDSGHIDVLVVGKNIKGRPYNKKMILINNIKSNA